MVTYKNDILPAQKEKRRLTLLWITRQIFSSSYSAMILEGQSMLESYQHTLRGLLNYIASTYYLAY